MKTARVAWLTPKKDREKKISKRELEVIGNGVSDPNPADSGGFWIWIQIRRIRIQGLKKYR